MNFGGEIFLNQLLNKTSSCDDKDVAHFRAILCKTTTNLFHFACKFLTLLCQFHFLMVNAHSPFGTTSNKSLMQHLYVRTYSQGLISRKSLELGTIRGL